MATHYARCSFQQWNVHDFVSSQLTHNQTYAFELPPTFLEQTRALVNFHENGVFGGGSDLGDMGNSMSLFSEHPLYAYDVCSCCTHNSRADDLLP